MGLPAKKENFKLNVDRSDMGKADTLRYNVLTFVVEENYDRAIHELREFMRKDSEYPKFKEKTERYISHAIDLVNAIRAKRKFPGAAFMTMAKQQELNDRFREHFNELQTILKRVEKTHVDLKIEDIRSTVWVLKAAVHAAFAILVIAFVLEITHGLGETAGVVLDDGVSQTLDWVFSKLNM